jgi:hypothetical protein
MRGLIEVGENGCVVITGAWDERLGMAVRMTGAWSGEYVVWRVGIRMTAAMDA